MFMLESWAANDSFYGFRMPLSAGFILPAIVFN